MAATASAKSSELIAAIRGLSAARDLPYEVILEALREALRSAYRRLPEGTDANVTVDILESTGDARVIAHYTVVDAPYIQDVHTELSVEAAQKYQEGAKIGDTLHVDVTPHDFGRIAAQTARQVIVQKIREAEREQTYFTYAEREGELVIGTVQNIGKEAVTVALDRVEATLPKQHQIPGERYSPNQRLRFFVTEVRRTFKGPQVVVSRTHRDMLRRLMELEIPEIVQGAVEIKAIAREAGSRSKVAVWSLQDGIDPVGACVGIRGVRIQALVRELGGEKIDIVNWDPDPRVFIANALSPAKVLFVSMDESAEHRTGLVIVPDGQLSLAIGREGQNARLAAKLTNWRIDIKAESEAGVLMTQVREAEVERAAERAKRAADEATRPKAEPEEVDAPAIEMPVLVPAPVPVEKEVVAAPAPPTEVETPPVVAPTEATEDDEGELPDAAAAGKKKKKKGKRLVRDPRTGQLVAALDRRGSRQRPDWDEEIDEELEIEDTLGFTEEDFLVEEDEDDAKP